MDLPERIDALRKELMAGLAANSPLRGAAWHWDIFGDLPPNAFDAAAAAMEQSGPLPWRERALAALVLGAGADTPLRRDRALPLLLRQVYDAEPRSERTRRSVQGLRYAAVGGTVTTLALWIWAGLYSSAAAALYLLIALPVFGFSSVLFALPLWAATGDVTGRRAGAVRRAALLSITRLRDSRAAEATIWALFDRSSAVREEARRACRAVLPLLTVRDYGRVAPGTIRDLVKLLIDWDTELTLLALEALDKVGTGAALQPVEQLLNPYGDERVRVLAERVAGTLRRRQAQERAPHRLLRPSDTPAGEALLRPADGAGGAEPAVLLRPGARADE